MINESYTHDLSLRGDIQGVHNPPKPVKLELSRMLLS